MTPVRSNRRGIARSQYRDTHMLLVNIPTAYRPAPSEIDGYLAEQLLDTVDYSRILLFGVKLQSTVGDGGFQAAVNSVTLTFLEGGTPMSDYDKDFRMVGLTTSSDASPNRTRLMHDRWLLSPTQV
jgi:hypothetical protein